MRVYFVPQKYTPHALQFAVFFLAAIVAVARPVKETTPVLRIHRVNRPPQIQDFLGGTPRDMGAVVSEFVQRRPGDGKPVSRDTKAYVSYDDKNLYVIFVCAEARGQLRTGMVKREDLGDHDRVSILLDTFHDRHRAYLFSSNANGIQRDGVVTEGRGTDTRFDAVWYSEGRLTAEGFVVWMAIPFRSIRFSPGAVQRWGIALQRSFIRNNEEAYWPYITERKAGFVRQMANLEGLESISAGRNQQFIPYITGAAGKVLAPNASGYVRERELRGGVDSKTVLRDSFTLDFTVNPDFSQVESDDPQVTINRRFEVLFPEKRPFFLENSGFFESPINLFFSRRIANPEFGARLTGKVGRWTLGALAVDDRAPGQRLAPNHSLFERRSINGVLRVQREFGEQSRIGFVATDREFGSNANRAAALDTRLKLSPNWFLTGQYARSSNRAIGGSRLNGSAVQAELSHSGRHFSYVTTYSDRSPGFRAPLGFIPRVDIRQVKQYAGYFWYPESKQILSVGMSFSASPNWDRKGRLQDWYGNAELAIDFAGPVGIRLTQYEGFEFIDPYRLRYGKSGISFYAAWLKNLTFYGSFSTGSAANYNPGVGLPLYSGSAKDASFGFTMRPAPRLRLEQFYFFDHLSAPSRFDAQPDLSGRAAYTSHLSRTKLNYQFTRALSVRGILDYYAVMPEMQLFNQDRFKQLGGDVLVTYMLHPGTALHFGTTSRYENLLRLERDRVDDLVRSGAPAYLTGRQYFVKLSYLLRF